MYTDTDRARVEKKKGERYAFLEQTNIRNLNTRAQKQETALERYVPKCVIFIVYTRKEYKEVWIGKRTRKGREQEEARCMHRTDVSESLLLRDSLIL
jgi:hypothetical protein